MNKDKQAVAAEVSTVPAVATVAVAVGLAKYLADPTAFLIDLKAARAPKRKGPAVALAMGMTIAEFQEAKRVAVSAIRYHLKIDPRLGIKEVKTGDPASYREIKRLTTTRTVANIGSVIPLNLDDLVGIL